MIKPSKKFNIISVGGATRDILFYSQEGELISTGNMTKQKLLAFEYGAKIMADKLYFTFGGGATNSAVSFSRLGLKAAVICRLGHDDNGRAALKNLTDSGVATGLVKVDAKAATGFSMILTVNNEAKEHVAFLHRGANNNLSVADLPLDRLSADWFYVTSLPPNGWDKIMSALTKSKKHLVWNPGRYQLAEISKMKQFLPAVKVFIVNHDEALEFKKLKDIKGLLSYFKTLGPELVVITDGAKGAYVYDGKKYYFMKAKTSRPVNTLGVGDAFGSGFTAALVCDKNIKEALRWGINNSASVVAKIGAQAGLLNRRQIAR